MVTQAEAKKTLRGEPLSARIVASGDLILTSYFFDGCLLFLEVQLPTLADFLIITHWTGHRDPGFIGLLGPASSQDP